MIKIFSKKPEVALSIEPFLSFSSIGNEVKMTFDSGDSDLNQRVAHQRLDEKQSSSIKNIITNGFDVIYEGFKDDTPADKVTIMKSGFDDQTTPNLTHDKDDAKAELKTKANLESDMDADIAPRKIADDALLSDSILLSHLKLSPENTTSSDFKRIKNQIQDAFDHDEGVVLGRVVLELAAGELYELASPIYTVIPGEDQNDDGSYFVAINDIQDYISGEWSDAFKDALLSMADESAISSISSANNAPVRANRRSESGSQGLLRYNAVALQLSIAVAIVAVFGAFYAIAGTPNFLNKGTESSTNVFATASVSPSDILAELPKLNVDKNDDGLPTIEQLAAVQTAAAESVIKNNLNLDVNATADLGCLAQ